LFVCLSSDIDENKCVLDVDVVENNDMERFNDVVFALVLMVVFGSENASIIHDDEEWNMSTSITMKAKQAEE
jgi:hypothetical protein